MDRNRGYCFMTKQDRKVSNKLNLKKDYGEYVIGFFVIGLNMQLYEGITLNEFTDTFNKI